MSKNGRSQPAPVVRPSIDEATLTFVRTIMESVTQPHPSQALALNAFSTAFQRWNPQSINDITPTDKATMDFLFAKPPFLPAPVVPATATTPLYAYPNNAPSYDNIVKGTIQQYQRTIGTLVQKFNHALTNGTLTKKELQDACTTIESSTWDRYKLYCDHQQQTTTSTVSFGNAHQNHMVNNIILPSLSSVATITNEIDKIEQLKRTIKQYTSVCIQGKSYSLGDYTFQNYQRRGMERLDVSEKFCTSALQQQFNSIQSVIGTNPDFLYWYAYFNHHTSIFLPSTAVALPVAGRIFNIDASCKQIKDAFGPSMNYSGVGTAMQLLSNANDSETEIKVLLNCQILKISALDVTTFRAVKLLHEIAKPLQDFIQCCELHQFKVVEHDPSFRALQNMVEAFYSTELHDRQSCLEIGRASCRERE